MEIAKFILAAVGTFISVSALSFTIFQHWRKKQEEKIDSLKNGLGASIDTERKERKEAFERLNQKVDRLENMVFENFGQRLSGIEGMLKAMKPTLDKIQEWFINNTPRGK
jgi:hypothetical protein